MESCRELQSGRYTATLRDETGSVVPASSLSFVTLTLRDEATRTVINFRDAQNVLNAHDVTITEEGLITWALQPLDNIIVNSGRTRERHVAVFEFFWLGGTKRHWEALELEVTQNPD